MLSFWDRLIEDSLSICGLTLRSARTKPRIKPILVPISSLLHRMLMDARKIKQTVAENPSKHVILCPSMALKPAVRYQFGF